MGSTRRLNIEEEGASGSAASIARRALPIRSWPARRVSYAVDDDLAGGRAVENQVGIGRRDDAPDIGLTGEPSHAGLLRQSRNKREEARLNLGGALRRLLTDRVQNTVKFGRGPAGIADDHRPCFAQMARISSSLANSPRSV